LLGAQQVLEKTALGSLGDESEEFLAGFDEIEVPQKRQAQRRGGIPGGGFLTVAPQEPEDIRHELVAV
jgi:hypothetical protein